ncbi:TetR/AcrR family transcriptional regulator [Planctomonas sp. JC2975]|uniref:TetR/AcrR family transcriptional regulator C-terminal domain-containing protein n=1 Tax=Planctomonas sp. JC2975 TaxID=2729626 RepID=UPI001474DF8F|nr:TetR/AcrR family transcriptional regulator [Planctomonas sp. JC2975]
MAASEKRDEAAVDGVAALLWTEPTAVRRGPKPKFTLTQVADAAVVIADEEGLEAVTMQRVAERLGATKMALYRYVPGRVELNAVMLERAMGEPEPSGASDWRTALRDWAVDLHGRAVARPWAVELVQRPHLPGPVELEWFESGLRIMTGLHLTGAEMLDVLALLVGHVMAVVRQQSGTGAPEDQLLRALAPVLASRADDFPLTTAAFTQDEGARDDALRFGIGRVIAGVDALLAERDV